MYQLYHTLPDCKFGNRSLKGKKNSPGRHFFCRQTLIGMLFWSRPEKQVASKSPNFNLESLFLLL